MLRGEKNLCNVPTSIHKHIREMSISRIGSHPLTLVELFPLASTCRYYNNIRQKVRTRLHQWRIYKQRFSYRKNRDSSGHVSLYSREASTRKLADVSLRRVFIFKLSCCDVWNSAVKTSSFKMKTRERKKRELPHKHTLLD